MRTTNLMEGIQFGDIEAHGEPLFVDKLGRVIRFSLKPGQSIKEHNAPNSPVYIVVLRGKGMFAGGDGKEQLLGVNSMLIIDPKENHTIRATGEELVFVTFLHGAPSNVSEKKGGKLGRKKN